MSGYVEEADFDVTLDVRLSTRIYFAAIKRDTPLTKADAIDNAIGLLPNTLFDGFGGEFVVAPIDGKAERP